MSDSQPKVTSSSYYVTEKPRPAAPPPPPVEDKSGGFKLLKAFRQIAGLILFAYGLLINFYLVTHFACWDCVFVTAQANHFAVWITLSGVIAFVLAVVLWTPKVVWAWLLPGVIVFGWWFAPNFLPKSEPTVVGTPFSAATYNVWDENGDHEEIFRVVREMNVDILAVQEMSPELQQNIQTQLADQYPHIQTAVQGVELLGIASRFPIVESRVYPGAFMRAVLDINGRQVVVYNLHAPNAKIDFANATFNDSELDAGIEGVLAMIQQETLPVLLLCDCNTTPRTRQYALLDETLDDAFKKQGQGFGHTHRGATDLFSFPTIRIDYLWYSEQFTPMKVEVWAEDGSSDHFPVRAEMALEG